MKISDNLLPAVAVAMGIALSGWFIYKGFDTFAHKDRQVAVRGLAEREVMADKVTWPLVVKTLGNNLSQVYEELGRNNDIVIKFLKDNGVSDSEISVSEPKVFDRDGQSSYRPDVAYRYNVTVIVKVTSSQVEKVNNLIKRQTDLLKSGVALSTDYQYNTTYEYTSLNDIKPEMIAEATKNAKAAADKFAEDSDCKVGSIKTASQGQFSITDRDAFTPWMKKVRVVTSVTYYIEDK